MAPPKSSQPSSGSAGVEGSSTSATASTSAAAAASTSSARSTLPSSKSSSPKPQSSSNSTSHKLPASLASSSYSVLPKMSDPTPPPSSANRTRRSSSPAAAAATSTSSISKRPSRDSTNGDSTNGTAATNGDAASHYGTRSRNRTGGARPNYAEDKDMDMFEMYPERRDDEPAKKAESSSSSSRKSANAGSSGSTAAGASSSASLLDREPLRPTNGHSNGSSERERERDRLRKPLPSSSANAYDSGAASSSNHQNSTSHSKSSSSAHSQHKDRDHHHASSVASTNGTSSQSQSSSNPRKRKAAAGSSSSDKASPSSGSSSGTAYGSSTPLLNISLKKNGAAAAAAAAAASSASHADGTNGYGNTNLMTFEKHGAKPTKAGQLVADDGSVLNVNDHVYLVCEPPGEPYYLGRVMEFLHPKNNTSLPVDAVRVNWYYRPRDIGRKAQDTRSVFATMHSDISPLTALRGKCTIKHKAEIDSLDLYRKEPNCFWFDKLYDRYIQKNYEVIPTFQIVNVPDRVKKVLHERWRYILIEQGRGKDLTAAAKQCKRCSGFCASNNSVDCAVCAKTYHMSCVRPPLLKKPSRGFAWSCAACSRAQERLLEARHTPNVIDGRTPDATGAAAGAATAAAADDDELLDDDDEDGAGGDTGRTSPDQDEDAHPPATAEQQYQASLWPYRYLGIHCKVEDALDYDDRIYPRAATRVGPRHQAVVLPWPGRPVEYVMPPDIKKATRREARQNKEALAAYERERESRPKWIQDTPAGYIERGQDYDDDDERNTAYLLYKSPNAPPSVPPAEKPAAGAADADAGSADCKMDIDPPETKDAKTKKTPDISDEEIDQFMDKAVAKAAKLGVPPRSTNLHDVAADLLFHNNFNTDKALKELDRKKPDEFREPILNAAEYKRFEDAVTKFGSELHLVTRHVKTVFYGDIVRYYYAWKKSERGKIIWGNNASRKGKKEAKEAKKAEAAAANKIQDDVADDVDDSAFDTDKADALKRQFQCKFCSTKTSRQWRHAPAAVPTGVLAESLGGGSGRSSNRERSQNQNTQQYVAALCRRCSELWRRYAVQWEDVEALTAKVTNAGGRLVKRKLDDELMKEIAAAEEMIRLTEANFSALHQSTEPPRKRLKGQNGSAADKDADYNASDSASSSTYPASSSNNRRRDRERANAERAAAERDRSATAERASGGGRSNGSTPAVGGGRSSANAYSRTVAELLPEPKKLPCAVCLKTNLANEDQRVVCRDCRLTVHRSCYGVLDNRNPHKWLCDMCTNDRNPHMSINYNCVLCPVEHSKPAAGAQTSSSHSKRSDAQGRERDRIDREQAKKADEYYRKRQEELNKPVNPREALKRTADNNWIHVTCAVWTPEIKFGRARALEPAEGVASVPRARYDEQCKICKTKSTGACVSCNQCRAQFHVQCAHQAGYIFGFDLVPVKGSRRDQANIVTLNGVNGLLVPAIWCRDHIPLKSSAYLPYEKIDGSDMSGLQFYVENYKQADLALTGCARKANLLSIASKMSGSLVAGANSAAGRGSSPDQNTAPQSNGSNSRQGSVYLNGDFGSKLSAATATAVGAKKAVKDNKVCLTCGSDVSPKWHAIDKTQERELANGFYGKMGEEAQKFVAQRNYQCHKCKKTGRKPSPHSHDREMHDRAVHGLEHVHREQERAQEHELARGLVTEFTSHPHGGRPNPQASPHTQHHHHRSGSSQGHIAHSLTGTPSQSRETEHRSTVVKREEEPYSDDMQRLAPRYPPESDLSRPPPSQSQLHQAPPLLPAHQQPLPPPSQSLSQPQTPSQLPPRAPSSHHHNILHPVDHARPDPPQRSPYSHAQQLPASTHPPSSSGGPPTGLGSSRSPPDMAPRYWSSNMGSSGAAPPPPPPLPQQAPPPLTSIRPGSSRGTPSPHTMHSAPHMQQHHSPHSMSVPPRSSVSQQAPPAPVHPYSSSSYSDWRRPPTSSQAPPPPPPSSRREPLHSASTSNSFTHNHLRPPPLSGMQNSGSSGGEYMGQSVMNGRPPSPPRRSLGGPPPPLAHERNSRDPYGHSYGGHAPYGTSHGSSQHSPQMQSTSPHHPFAQMLHPQRSASSNASFMNAGLNTNNVTREDFTLRGPANNAAPPPPRPSEPRNGSSASSNPSLRNLLS